MRRLVMFLEGDERAGEIGYEAELALLWIEALAQHYGAGSPYLDVTHDLGVAVWFECHSPKLSFVDLRAEGMVHDDEIPMKTGWYRFVQQRGPAYIYVLDLKPWSTEHIPEPGDLVDLAQAPATFHSARIAVQSGCLAYPETGDDLARCVVGGPFVMESGFEQSPYAVWSVEQIFPPPSSDGWFQRLLSIPFLLGPHDHFTNICLTEALPVMLFRGSDAYMSELRGHCRALSPVLVHPHIDVDIDDDEMLEALEEATVLVLEGPQISAHPAADDPTWHHGLLMSDRVADVDAFDAEGTAVGRVRLDNVIVEFSPLESVGWPDVDDDALRALWIQERPDGTMAVYLLFQDPYEFLPEGPLLVRFNARRGRLECSVNSEASWQDLAAIGTAAKPILSSLVMLRDLSTAPKATPYPIHEFGLPSGRTYHVTVSSGAARLVFATEPGAARAWYVVRNPSGEPYTVAHDEARLSIDTPLPFARLPIDEFHRAIASAQRRARR